MPRSTPPASREWVESHCLVMGGNQSTDSTALLGRVTASGASKVVLYIHGGLVNEQAGIDVGFDLSKRVRESEGIYPLFLVWRTGPLEMLPDTLWRFLTDPRIVIPLLRWVFKLLGVDPVAKVIELAQQQFEGLEPTLQGPMEQTRRPLLDVHGPGAEEELARRMVVDERLVEGIEDTRTRRDSPFEADSEYLKAEFLEGVGNPSTFEGMVDPVFFYLAKKALEVARAVLGRKGTPTWHGWRDTSIEELVRSIGMLQGGLSDGWEAMKAKAEAAYKEASGPGVQLATDLAEWVTTDPSRELHIVAHSAGSFHAGHLLDALEQSAAARPVVRSLHLLAPACDHEFALQKFAQREGLVERQRLYLLRQPFEDDEGSFSVTTKGLGTIRFYDGSLLNVLSGLLEPTPGWPLLGLERWMVRGPQGARVKALFSDVLLAPTPVGAKVPDRCGAEIHGGFDNDVATWVSVLDTVSPGRVPVPMPVADAVDGDAENVLDWFDEGDAVGEDEPLWAANLEEGDVPLPPGPGTFEDGQEVVWASDADNIDIAHLPVAPATSEFTLDAAVLGRLMIASRFTHIGDDLVIFGLRGCQLVSGALHSEWAPSLALRVVAPDHHTRRCVIGLWNRGTGQVCGFEASTVPESSYVQAAADGTRRANLLPTGAYRYKVGRNRNVPGVLRVAERQMVVLRQLVGKSPAGFSSSDTFAEPAFVADNLHPAFRSDATFSSAGCQTIAGSYSGGSHTGSWEEFRSRAGVVREGPRRWWYLLWTGREAQVASHEPATLPTVLRVGSRGEEVKALQRALNVSTDGVLGPHTMFAFTHWRRAQREPASSVVTSGMMDALAVGLEPHRAVPTARATPAHEGLPSGRQQEAAPVVQSAPAPQQAAGSFEGGVPPEDEVPAQSSTWRRVAVVSLLFVLVAAVAVAIALATLPTEELLGWWEALSSPAVQI